MKTVNLGYCCQSCFDALHFNAVNLTPERMEAAAIAAKELNERARKEGVQSLHTGDSLGFRQGMCLGCYSELAGERFELFGLREEYPDEVMP